MKKLIETIEASSWRLPAVIDRLRELGAGKDCTRNQDFCWLKALAAALEDEARRPVAATSDRALDVGPFSENWELVNHYMSRFAVIGGWLVSVDVRSGEEAIVFVPDLTHQWVTRATASK